MDQAPSAASEFPNGPALQGKVYVMDTQYDQKVIIMSQGSWEQFATAQESMRNMLQKQDTRIKELLAENAVAKDVASDATTRLENIRHARREEMRARIEPQVADLVLPGNSRFNTNRK